MGWLHRRRMTGLAVALSTFMQITPVYLVALGADHFMWDMCCAGCRRGVPYAAHLQPAWSWEFISSLLLHAVLPMLSVILTLGAGFTLGMRALMVSVSGRRLSDIRQSQGYISSDHSQGLRFPQCVDSSDHGPGDNSGRNVERNLHRRSALPTAGAGGHFFVQAMGLRDFQHDAGSRSLFHLRRPDAHIDRRSCLTVVGSPDKEYRMKNTRIPDRGYYIGGGPGGGAWRANGGRKRAFSR